MVLAVVTLLIVAVELATDAELATTTFCTAELSAVPLNATTQKLTVVAPEESPRVAVTVVPDRVSPAKSLVNVKDEVVEEPMYNTAAFAFVTADMEAVPVVAAVAIVTVPNCTELMRFVVLPSTTTALMVMVSVEAVLRVAVTVVELVSVTQACADTAVVESVVVCP